MTYKCKRCGKTSITQKGLHCFRCDHEEAQQAGTTVIYSTPPCYNEITEIKTEPDSSSFTGGGGSFGGGGVSSSWDSSSDSSSSSSGSSD